MNDIELLHDDFLTKLESIVPANITTIIKIKGLGYVFNLDDMEFLYIVPSSIFKFYKHITISNSDFSNVIDLKCGFMRKYKIIKHIKHTYKLIKNVKDLQRLEELKSFFQ